MAIRHERQGVRQQRHGHVCSRPLGTWWYSQYIRMRSLGTGRHPPEELAALLGLAERNKRLCVNRQFCNYDAKSSELAQLMKNRHFTHRPRRGRKCLRHMPPAARRTQGENPLVPPLAQKRLPATAPK